MVKIADPILVLFAVSLVCAFFLRFIKDAVYKQINLKHMLERLKLTALAVLPYLALFFAGQHFGVPAAGALPYFGGAVAASFLLSGLNLPSYLRGILLLAGCVAVTILAPSEHMLVNLSGLLLGLVSFKVTENLCFSEQSTFDDVAGAVIWLTGVMWITSVDQGKMLAQHLNTLLGVLSVSYLIKFFQGPILKTDPGDDKWFVKRLMLSLTAALGVVIVLVKMLNLPENDSLYFSLLCGGSFFTTYLLKNVDSDALFVTDASRAVKVLMLMGLLTVLSTRLFGTFGLIALAPACIVAPLSSIGILPGLFFAGRVLLQVFVQNYNLNVTGINLTHQYTSAAMYAGFLLAVVLTVFFKEISDRRVLLVILTAAGIGVPVMSNFLLHAEPTSSLLVSLLVASSMLAVVAPCLQRQPARGTENIMLVPFLAAGSGIMTSGLIEAGNQATIADKTNILGWGIGLLLAVTLVYWFMWVRSQPKQSEPPATPPSGEAAA